MMPLGLVLLSAACGTVMAEVASDVTTKSSAASKPLVERSPDHSPDYATEVRPILAAKCYACHGPDEEGRQGGFRIDQRESATAAADSGSTPIVPGDPSASEILSRIAADDDSIRMPPPETHKSVSKTELQLLQDWIAEGAQWGTHWAFDPPSVTASVELTSGAEAIDQFIHTRLQELDIQPTPQAGKRALVRRVSLGVTGLPPSAQQVQAYLSDDQPNAYERFVDRLLASPAYGEHMARHWLDAARYADTHGLNLDNYREMWLYRDWVIKAFNDNLPYDQFVTEQLAGDLLANATQDQLIATGFNRCHLSTGEGGSIVEEVRARNVSDRVDTFGTVFLGLTVGCARCHDHKYDPITAQDYYSLYAFFNSLDGPAMDGGIKDPAPVVRRPTTEQQLRLAYIKRRVPQLDNQLAHAWDVVDQAQTAWEADVREALRDRENNSPRVALGDWYLAKGFYQSDKGLDEINRENYRTAFRPERGPVNLKQFYPTNFGHDISWKRKPEWHDGLLRNDLYTTHKHSTVNYLYRKLIAKSAGPLRVSLGADDGFKVFLNGQQIFENNGLQEAAPHQYEVELQLNAGVNQLLLKVVNYAGKSGFFFALPDDAAVAPPKILKLIALESSERSEKQYSVLREYYRENVCQNPELMQVRAERRNLLVEKAKHKAQTPTTLVFREREEPRPAFVLERGEYDQLGPPAPRGTPAFLPPMTDGAPRNRLGLAQWLVGSHNGQPHPLTSRVLVNRVWQQLFGAGIVSSAGDFGSQGDLPSHPELLDWLAIDFVQHGWDIKRLVKQIVSSEAYRRQSQADPTLRQADPGNRWLARFPRRRLDAETLRDQALAVSGLLVREVGGPSVKPPQPKGLWAAVGYTRSNTSIFHADEQPEKRHRRTLYTFIKRTSGPPQMTMFDAPSRESCIVRRERTNTPLQALLLLNDTQYLEAAVALANQQVNSERGDINQQANAMFESCLCRTPSAVELATLKDCYLTEHKRFLTDPQLAAALLSSCSSPRSKMISSSEQQCRLAAWALVANVIMNLDEFVSQN